MEHRITSNYSHEFDRLATNILITNVVECTKQCLGYLSVIYSRKIFVYNGKISEWKKQGESTASESPDNYPCYYVSLL